MEHYRLYSVQDFINDDHFQDWVFQPKEETNQLWESIMKNYPETIAAINEAKQALQGISFREDFPSEENVNQLLQQVMKKINEPEKGKRILMKPYLRWVAAAAVVLVCGSIYLLVRNNKQENIAATPGANKPDQIIKPGGDKAVLTLGDGSVVVLDSTGNGAIASQGNSTIVNLNGKLLYNAEDGSKKAEVVYNIITTPKGGQYQLLLADGSKVWLNSASSLRFPTSFDGKERIVELSGEGYFEIAHNAAKPFRVKAKETEVEVLGTHFNINAYNDEPSVNTTLLQGRVKVIKNKQFVFLNPGQQAVAKPLQDEMRINNDVDVEEVIAWKNGKFLFNGADIETIMRQISRWYDVDVVFEKKSAETISGGLSRAENVSQLLNILEATGKVQFKINGKQIIVITK